MRIGIATILTVPLAAFFAFVGYHKTFAPIEQLRQFGAWTVHLPEVLGRIVGVSEIACAVLLCAIFLPRARRWAGWSALALIVNQLIATGFHLAHNESGALPQNGLLITLLCVVAWANRPRVAMV